MSSEKPRSNGEAERARQPPFAGGAAVFGTEGKPPLIFPANYIGYDGRIRPLELFSRDDLPAYLRYELDLSRLNVMAKLPWYMWDMRPRCGRSLLEQLVTYKRIVAIERADCHLVYQDEKIFIKPLPSILLDHGVWERHICRNITLYEAAAGFVLSWTWLLLRESDFRLAQKKLLLPTQLSWESWTNFARSFVTTISTNIDSHIHPRYRYPELNSRVLDFGLPFHEKISSRWFGLIPFTDSNYSYLPISHGLFSFLKRNADFFVPITAYIALVLTAMQVGLATSELRNNPMFNSASYGFTVFAIVAPLISSLNIIATLSLKLITVFALGVRYIRKGYFSSQTAK